MCCGIYGPEDWEELYNNDTLPNSCCTVLNEFYECTYTYAFKEGCLTALTQFVESSIRILTFSLIFVAVVQVSGGEKDGVRWSIKCRLTCFLSFFVDFNNMFCSLFVQVPSPELSDCLRPVVRILYCAFKGYYPVSEIQMPLYERHHTHPESFRFHVENTRRKASCRTPSCSQFLIRHSCTV